MEEDHETVFFRTGNPDGEDFKSDVPGYPVGIDEGVALEGLTALAGLVEKVF
jgi:hypothetical protein